jgi:hypothetical protein
MKIVPFEFVIHLAKFEIFWGKQALILYFFQIRAALFTGKELDIWKTSLPGGPKGLMRPTGSRATRPMARSAKALQHVRSPPMPPGHHVPTARRY